MRDERKGWTSASNAEADNLCPGRHFAQKNCQEEINKDSEFGNNFHLALKGENVELDKFQRSILEKAKKIEQDVLDQIFGEGIVKREDAIRERRLWITDAEHQLSHSGQVDAVWIKEDTAVIEDAKSLAGEISQSSKNMQLRDLSCLVWINIIPIKRVVGFINQPLVTINPEIVIYEEKDLSKALDEMLIRVRRSNLQNSPRIAGVRQCKFCRAKAICKEHKEWVVNESKEIVAALENKLSLREQKVEYYRKAKPILAMLQRFVKHVEDDIKANPNNYPGFIVETTDGNREIADPQKAYEAVQDVLTMEEYLSLLKVPIGDFEKKFSKVLQEMKKNIGEKFTIEQCEDEFAMRISPFIKRGARTIIKPVKKAKIVE